ncbi:MAG: hypothetical protein KGL39_09925 [Patescibacteria group bacterium]|nr:hypothetical protein [Patescibacteria group bacterium]
MMKMSLAEEAVLEDSEKLGMRKGALEKAIQVINEIPSEKLSSLVVLVRNTEGYVEGQIFGDPLEVLDMVVFTADSIKENMTAYMDNTLGG